MTIKVRGVKIPNLPLPEPSPSLYIPDFSSTFFFQHPKKKQKMPRLFTKKLIFCLLVFSLYPLSLYARSFSLVVTQDDINDTPPSPQDDDSADWDNFGDSETEPEKNVDPGSWSPIFEPSMDPDGLNRRYHSTVAKIMSAVRDSDEQMMAEATSEIEEAANEGEPHAQSVLAFLYGMGMMRERNKAKAFMYHHFAAEGGSMQSKMALAYTYLRQDVSGILFAVQVVIYLFIYFRAKELSEHN